VVASDGSVAGLTIVGYQLNGLVEGVTVAPDGTVYSASYGYNRDGALGGYGELFVFAPNGQLLTHFPVIGSSPHLIGLEYQQSSKSVLIADLGKGVVWKVDPETHATSMFARPVSRVAIPKFKED